MQHHFYFDPLHVKRGTEYPRKQDLCYNPSTVVGNWFEERLAYKKNRFKHTTSYLSQFFPKPYSRVSPNVVWSEKFKSDLANPIVHSKDGCWDYPNFFENFASTYDLSFNHYPKWYNNIGHIDRKLRFRMSRFEPMEDYIDSFATEMAAKMENYVSFISIASAHVCWITLIQYAILWGCYHRI
ncbi:hypothetical protein HHI36_007539 [Cryptolaemus montrouzieri]|uniref:Uncharacterized protein n=1 Tax=Cryptolaemus montrouzieri TaxID=559131 RepID=A0ABD2MPT4_9CUCU